jgi:hypothetical protein
MDSSTNMYMPVAPAYGYGNNGFGGSWGGDGWWIILFLFALMGNSFGGWGGFGNGFGGYGNMALSYDFPWLMNGQQGINSNVNDGFRDAQLASQLSGIQSAVTSGFGDTALGIAGINQNICQTGNGITAAVTNGFANAEVANNARQIANMQQAFNAQTSVTNGLNTVGMSLQNCCCENRQNIADLKYTVATENCADRAASYQNTRDIIDSQTRGTQAVLDKLCQLELDNVKAQVEAKNDQIRGLQSQLNMAALRESQNAQNAFIQQGFSDEVDQLYNRLNNCPVPSTPVYGRTPIFTCNQNMGCGCGCGVA